MSASTPQTGTAIANLRRDYQQAGLTEADVDPDPIKQFERWFNAALQAGIPEPNAMTLGTAGRDGMPGTRTVLLKGFDARGFVFYTNYESRKARQLSENPQASLLFPWVALERQIEILGRVEKVSREETAAYFHSRPVASQLGAWASHQSAALSDRDELEKRVQALQVKYQDQPVPVPPFWGGYRVLPGSIEFWQGRANRLHDRLRYSLESDGTWKLVRLSP